MIRSRVLPVLSLKILGLVKSREQGRTHVVSGSLATASGILVSFWGLALAAVDRGFKAEVWVSQRGPLFIDGVRDLNKKRVMRLVHESFTDQAREQGLRVHYTDIDQQQIVDSFVAGANVLVLISTYRLDNRKAPHWVVLSGYDENCLFFHDPDLPVGPYKNIADESRNAIECQHLPIAREDFASMSLYGGDRLRAAVVVSGSRA